MSDPQQDGAVEPPLDWMTIGQYAMLAALCDLVPVPILDSWLENLIRRRMVRAIGMKRGWPFDDAALKILGDRPSGAAPAACSRS